MPERDAIAKTNGGGYNERKFGGERSSRGGRILNKQLKTKIGAGLCALALVVGGGGYYYFHVHTDTPGTAIETLGYALERHNVTEFNRVVDVDSLLDSGYDGFVEGVTASVATDSKTRDAIKNFTHMLRGPMLLSLKTALNSYVANGELKTDDNVGIREILERTGLNGVEIRDVKNLQPNDADKNEAFVDVVIHQPELENDFPLRLVLNRTNDRWQVTRVQNFQEYVEQINRSRRMQLDDYLAKSGEINSKHDAFLRENEHKYGMILSLGNLSKDNTRADLKRMITDVFAKDWEARKQELFGLHVPRDAEPLHNLYLRICDQAIDAASDYAKWMDDNNTMTIKSAEEKIHRVQEMISEASDLARRMTS